jgi:hypothetical protein
MAAVNAADCRRSDSFECARAASLKQRQKSCALQLRRHGDASFESRDGALITGALQQ